jgi:multisubunit Na+/H+ antiporter MnhE subunit
VKHVAAFLLFGVVLWWLWLLLAGEWNRTQWIAATGAAAIAAFVAEVARTRARSRPALPLRLLASVPSALGMVLVDFGLVLWALVAGRRGEFRTTDSDAAGDEQSRAWAAYIATISPNAYVIDFDPDAGTVLTHHLVPKQASQDPA